MTKMIADTGVYYHGETFQTDTEFEVPEEAAKRMEAQGLAHRAGSKQAKQPDNQTPEQPETPETVEVSTEMTRAELDAAAEGLGMTDLEQYSTKAELVEAIQKHQ